MPEREVAIPAEDVGCEYSFEVLGAGCGHGVCYELWGNVISTGGRNPSRFGVYNLPTILPNAAWLDFSSQGSLEMTAIYNLTRDDRPR
jgi:hypothetical protein